MLRSRLLLLPSPRQYHRSSRLLDWRRRSQSSKPGVSSDSTASGSCLDDADRDDISGIQFPSRQSSFLLAAGCAFRCGVSESGAAAESGADFKDSRQTAGGESFANERALGIGACRLSGASVRGLRHGRLFHEEFLLMRCAVAGS